MECRDCRADSSGAMELADGWAEVWDVPPVVLEKTHYLLPRRRCCCGATTTAAPPLGSAGSVSNLHVHAVNASGEAACCGGRPILRASCHTRL
jgi:hypothetical protein